MYDVRQAASLYRVQEQDDQFNMCIHRKQVCRTCRSPVHDVIVLRLAIIKMGMYTGAHVMDYTNDNA
ncbi:uncharacterized protein N7525_010930 [Penicillium rubens]|jgi:hypothetical protein|uniref:uncharacterized protein n=1 Tax=Penicillium rubens TaxID=1108849 RepID=UPI002A5AE09E|nr:uncharacterized protein N7525_010930 [Penicillium rubens]KAJ5821646.1 hypothetical protein N7525_010930 [Penicillium rubens]